MFCPNCGQELEDGALFCWRCGKGTTGKHEAPHQERHRDEYKEEQAYRVNPKTEPKKTNTKQEQTIKRRVEYRYSLPPENEPLSPWAYWGLKMLFLLPVVGFICLIVLSFNGNVNLRNFTRSYWCDLIISLILLLILAATGTLGAIISSL